MRRYSPADLYSAREFLSQPTLARNKKAVKKLLHSTVVVLGALSLYWTDLMSVSMLYGGILPLIDILFLVYLMICIVNFFAQRGSSLTPSSAVDVSSAVYSSNEDYSSCGSYVDGIGGGDAGDCGAGGE
jgi:hypothetical protein